MIPRATYRLQLNKGFGFAQAAALAPYLQWLGISHVYASPYLQARPGSTHGYDIVDHHRLNGELGGETAFNEMVAAFSRHGLSQILDFVPNHMGVSGADNPFWLDVLEWGQDSEHAGWFDIDWDPERRYLHGKLLVPVLGDQYGVELESGKITLTFDSQRGEFAVWAYDTHKLPICPRHYAFILGDRHPELERLGDCFSNLDQWRPQIVRRATELKRALAELAATDSAMGEAIGQAVARFTVSDCARGQAKALHDLIQLQHWRVAHFRVAADDINYRRFFNINDLAGLRVELPEVFEQAHGLVLKLLREGAIDGLRIDHVDGLLDPKGYLERLQAAMVQAARHRQHGSEPSNPPYLVVEKILASHECLRSDWPIHGTTGYDFTNLVLGILVDPAAKESLSRTYSEFTSIRASFSDVVRECKIRIMKYDMASELNVLAREAARVARQNPRTADFTRNILHRAIRETVACFAVYRTYVDSSGTCVVEDDQELNAAIERARNIETEVDGSVFDFLRQLMSGELVGAPRSGFGRQSVLRCAMKLQQYSGPVMAKGLEDTAFYRYNRFVALNEVGGHPEHFGTSLDEFHRGNMARARDWPNSMLATSTHDTKRGEDTRTRLSVISELPEEWAKVVDTWSPLLRQVQEAAPDRNDEYLFYQLLVGSWPTEFMAVANVDPGALEAYSERLEGAMTKSIREAKVHSTWASPNEMYERGALAFVRRALAPCGNAHFMSLFLPFAEKVARLGVDKSIAQTTLKLTVPGVPDTYQGSELWDLSLVDPDNRRAVAFDLRRQLLAEVTESLQRNRADALRAFTGSWHDGRIKLALTATLLTLRRNHAALFVSGTYKPCVVTGESADQICAFVRCHGDEALLVAVRRFALPERTSAQLQARVEVPPELATRSWLDCVSGAAHGPAKALSASVLFSCLPTAVLMAVR